MCSKDIGTSGQLLVKDKKASPKALNLLPLLKTHR